jgi:dTDP-4-dehydrorhamnose 3,5-epimerase
MKDDTILIIGVKGQLGLALQQQYPNAKSVNVDELDITNAESVANYDWSSIKIVFNAAAFTNVDGAETIGGRVAAWKVNAIAVGYLAKAALKNDLTFVHISTDYVFDGTNTTHDEDEPFSPLSVYGQSKAAGDIAVSLLPNHYILRTSWVIGEGKNFVRTMLDLGRRGVSPTVVSDQMGRPTFTSELVRAIDHLLSLKAPSGTYDVSNDGEIMSWADITRVIFKESGLDLTVTDTTTAEYYKGKDGIAPRPLNSALNLTKIKDTGFVVRNWTDDLKLYIQRENTKS